MLPTDGFGVCAAAGNAIAPSAGQTRALCGVHRGAHGWN